MINQIIIRPLITEKTLQKASVGQFIFKADVSATKGQIRQMVEKFYKVNVIKLRTNIVRGKSRRFGRKRNEVIMSDWKKAIVTLKKGQMIEAFSLTGQDNKS